MNISLTERDMDLLAILCCRVARLTDQQLSRFAQINSPSTGGSIRWVDRLVKSHLLEQRTVNLPPIREIAGPPHSWRPGQRAIRPIELTENPVSSAVANTQPTPVYFASRLTLNLYGYDQPQPLSHTQLHYDMQVAEVFLHYLCERPVDAKCWVHSRNVMPGAAYLQDSECRVFRLINVVDHFTLRKLEQFHDYCCERTLPYELWHFRHTSGPTESTR